MRGMNQVLPSASADGKKAQKNNRGFSPISRQSFGARGQWWVSESDSPHSPASK